MKEQMLDIIKSIDWWGLIILPLVTFIGKKVNDYLNARQYNTYVELLKNTTLDVVKKIYETQVKDIKNTEEWTKEKQEEVKLQAKREIVQGLSNLSYKGLAKANEDLTSMIDNLVGTALYDLKNK